MNRLADTLRRARALYLDGRVTAGTTTDGWGREGSRRTDRYGLGLGGKIIFWSPLLRDAADGDAELAFQASELLDKCSPDGWFELYADGARLLWEGGHIVGQVYDVDRKPAEVAATIGKACALAEAAATRCRSVAALAPREREEARPPPQPALVALAGRRRDPGYVAEPEEVDEDEREP